jgi:uncharacterized RDD family membrane protein YckC
MATESTAESEVEVSGENDIEEVATCLVSGEQHPTARMLPYGESWVMPEHAERWFTLVMESGDDSPGDDYVSIRRRGLALAIDFLVKLLPISLVHMPYYFAATDVNEAMIQSGGELGDGTSVASLMSVSFVVAYVIAKLGQTVINAGYETWMVGRYGATLGKMAVGAQVTSAEGERLSYGRALLRWVAKSLLNGLIFWTILGVPLALVLGLMLMSVLRGDDITAILPLALWSVIAVVVVFVPLSLFPYWMAISDREKRTLHDRVTGSRVREAETSETVRKDATGPEPKFESAAREGMIAAEADARCRFLVELKAETVCEACGALLSQPAAICWAGKSWCLPCVHRLRRDEKGDGSGFVAERKIYDNLALMMVSLLLPLSLLTAPVALYFLVRYRKAPRGLVPRSSLRWWLALVLSAVSLTVWLGLLALAISIMVRSLTG